MRCGSSEIRWFQDGRSDRAQQLLREGLGVARLINDQRNAAGCLEGLAWIAAQEDNPRDAAVLMGAADALAHAVGSVAIPLPRLHVFHDECERRAREELGKEQFDAAFRQGSTMSIAEAADYSLTPT